MRRVTKKLLLFFGGILVICVYCEFIIYYIVIAQCKWPQLKDTHNDEVLRAFILSDTHLLGPYRGHWLDKLRREWQMHRAFQTIIQLHRPDVVFILGMVSFFSAGAPDHKWRCQLCDLFDEGEWTDNEQFNIYVNQFHQLFSLPQEIKLFVVAGNHDIGFHNRMRRGSASRFSKLLNAPSVQHVVLKDSHFILINSVALEGDSCNLCTEARKNIEKISEKLMRCSQDSNLCHHNNVKYNYSRPILMQHFPLYRISDAICTEPDAPPLPERNKLFRLKIDALSKEATDYVVSKINPRAVFGGHTHHGCLVRHSNKELDNIEFIEYSVPSFSWRNRPDPKFMLLSISPNSYGVKKCGLPRETTIALSAIIMLLFLIGYILKSRSLGREL